MMNKRIKQLVKEAKDTGVYDSYGHIEVRTGQQFEQKLAELIIRECADLLEVEYGQSALTGNAAAKSIKKYFGIE